MNATALNSALQDLPVGEVHYFASIGSTNDFAAERIQAGASPFSVVVADEQTRGRGRGGRGWFTPPGAALAFSMLFYPQEQPAERLALFGGLGALAVARAFEELYRLPAAIKWPNDVLLGDAKTCGVLAEAHWEGSRLKGVVLGIGVNVTPGSVPPDTALQFPATCVEAALGRRVDRLALLRAVVAALLAEYPRLGGAGFLRDWQARLAFRDRRVQIIDAGVAVQEGTIAGLMPDGRLQLRDSSGQLHRIGAGELHLRPLE